MRPFFIGLSVALGFSINPLVLAQSAGPELQGLIQNFKLKRSDIARVIDLLLSSNKISQTQALDAKVRLKRMTDDEIKNLSMKALTNVHDDGPLFADFTDDKEKQQKTNARTPASLESKGAKDLPASPFYTFDDSSFDSLETTEQRLEREKLESIQKDIQSNFFYKKKYQ